MIYCHRVSEEEGDKKMKIDLEPLKRFHWFEDESGNIYDGMDSNLPKDIDYFTYHVVEPLVYSEPVDSYTYHPEHLHERNSFYHAMLHFKWFYKLMYKRMKRKGMSRTFKRIFTGHTHIGIGNEKIILAMANSGDYTLSEAIYVYATSCERCTNVLAYKYLNGEDGYAEYSEEWKKCNTSCRYCKDSREADKVESEDKE